MKIGIVGLGYVGLPLAVAFAEEGHEVVGVDTDQRKVASLRDGESYIEDVASERLAAQRRAGCAGRTATRTSPPARRSSWPCRPRSRRTANPISARW